MPAVIQITTSQDPFAPLAEAIGSALHGQQKPQFSAQLSVALHQVLEAHTPQSRNTRMLLIRHLVDVESQAAGITVPKDAASANDLISTAQAAEILGYSRPYVAMLIDQHKLEGATVSAGGHRRVSRAAVLAWKDQHQRAGKAPSVRTEGQKIGAYRSTEADAVRQIKALTTRPR